MRTAPPPPQPPPTIAEQPLPPSTTIELSVTPPRHTNSADGRQIFIEGKVRNRGSRPTREVKVWVSGLDASGNVVVKAETLPTVQLIPPGGSADYLVRLPNDPTIRRFHVEAIGR